MTAMIAVAIPAFAGSASAQTRRNYNRTRETRNYDRNNRNYDQNYPIYDQNQPNVYDRHRKAINIGVATGVGAIIGALIGGKKGALIGAGAGALGGVVVTAKQAPRNNTRYPYRY